VITVEVTTAQVTTVDVIPADVIPAAACDDGRRAGFRCAGPDLTAGDDSRAASGGARAAAGT
jgi:hypothetical protein